MATYSWTGLTVGAWGVSRTQELGAQCGALLGKFLAVREPNIRYLGLETMARLCAARPRMHAVVQMHQAQVSELLKDQDVSIRKRALDMLFVMCSPGTVQVNPNPNPNPNPNLSPNPNPNPLTLTSATITDVEKRWLNSGYFSTFRLSAKRRE